MFTYFFFFFLDLPIYLFLFIFLLVRVFFLLLTIWRSSPSYLKKRKEAKFKIKRRELKVPSFPSLSRRVVLRDSYAY